MKLTEVDKMTIPFVDLRAQYFTIKDDIDNAIKKVIEETAFISGKYAKQFETEFAAYCQREHCISCANGTDSLEILLQVFGIGPGDEVIVPANSWISTSESVSSRGATPVFVDIDENFLMDLSLVPKLINTKTRAIIPVHLYGNAVDMNQVMTLAKTHDLRVIEDCAQSHGATVNGKRAGTFGDAASYSFYPGKNLGAYGDAGAIVTDDPSIMKKARAIANHGQEGKHNHIMEGRNSRLDGIQAAILSAKLPHIEKWTEKRIEHAALYTRLISHEGVTCPFTRHDFRHVFHLYVVRVNNRTSFAAHLKERGIETAVHYPTPLPLLPCYSYLDYSREHIPVSSKIQNEIISLPMFAELTNEQIAYIAESINEWRD